MRIIAHGLIVGAALLGPVPVAMADATASTATVDSTASADSQAVPQTEVSMLAVLLTAGGALGTAGSGMALVLNRRRAVSRRPSRVSG